METSLHGRRALITGAGSGIGAAIAEAFAREGAHVAIHARSDERARPIVDAIEAAGGRAVAAAADLRDRVAIAPMCQAAVERLGGVGILGHKAGGFVPQPGGPVGLGTRGRRGGARADPLDGGLAHRCDGHAVAEVRGGGNGS
ncbi:MAG: SDR family NAD(P)-dependent oxidoreductase, partial [Rhodospirillaceae bacterium]|nr:SDR family NAD(P)-dependent oxidoreductase [Rhodospirillaceae bacterium]